MAEAASAGVNNRTEKVSALCNRYFSLITQNTAGREENQRKSHYFTIQRMETDLKKKNDAGHFILLLFMLSRCRGYLFLSSFGM